MSALTYRRNDDLESGTLDKMTVYQESLTGFNESPVNARKCRKLLAKLVHLLNTGETYSPDEATKLFFSVSKLFQHKDPSLRQMVYLAIKDLSVVANDVIMVTSSIMKDVQGVEELYKPNAIRTLVRVIDASIVQGIERLMKTAIVDKKAAVSSAALISSYHLLPISRDIVRRWANETQEAVTAQKSFVVDKISTASQMSSYHALGLLYQLRAHDKMALMRMIQNFTSQNSVRSPPALLMLLRFVAQILEDDNSLQPQLMSLLQGYLKHRSDMVAIEAAKIILAVRNVPEVDAGAAVQVLKVYLSTPKVAARFAAIRILNRFAMIRPSSLTVANPEIENLITDPSRAIATYAITTLLKTGNEASVDRLMTQISTFMSDITDEFKIIVVDAIKNLSLKFPAKYESMLSFLASTLRDDGGLKFKTAVVEALFEMIKHIPECRDAALGHLCEFIEDCEFAELARRILHLLGVEGPRTSQPTLYIRYIYNRVVLENSPVRAAAVSALAKFALVDDAGIQKSVNTLLQRCLSDVSDEVRDRAILSLNLISANDNKLKEEYLVPEKSWSLSKLEHALTLYISGGEKTFVTAFDISGIPDELPPLPASSGANAPASEGIPAEKKASKKAREELQENKFEKELAEIPEVASGYGPLLKSSNVVALTESETEYVVTAVKHIFKDYIVLQYNVANTLTDYVLENVTIDIAPEEEIEGFEQTFNIPITKLNPESSGVAYVGFSRPSGEDEGLLITSFDQVLRFVIKDVIDPSTLETEAEGLDDDYSLESLALLAGDYINPVYVGDLSHQWDELSNEASETYQMAGTTIPDVTLSIINQLSMMPLENTDIADESSHTLKLFGRTITGLKVAAQVRMVYSTSTGVTLKITVRSDSVHLSQIVAESVEAL